MLVNLNLLTKYGIYFSYFLMSNQSRIGQYVESSKVAGESFRSYIPNPLPPNPPIRMNEIFPVLDQATVALGRLDGISTILPDPPLFLYMYVRKEAVLSSQIEGTQSSLSDLLLYETELAPGAPINDVTEVSRYVAALNFGLDRLKELPLSLRLLREIHAVLMKDSRGGNKQPGEFRKSQNWIGGSRPGNARFVPPPPEYLVECLDKFEKFIHDETATLPALIKAALLHVQFETIHPFLDGNGRLGRLLITLLLYEQKVLTEPILYLSLYLKANRQQYYELLQAVREKGSWEDWIKFFLSGVISTANQAIETAQAILALFATDQKRIGQSNKSTPSALTIHKFLQQHPITNTTKIQSSCNLSLPTILRILRFLEKLNLVEEITGKERHKIFIYKEYLDILNRGTEPIVDSS